MNDRAPLSSGLLAYYENCCGFCDLNVGIRCREKLLAPRADEQMFFQRLAILFGSLSHGILFPNLFCKMTIEASGHGKNLS